VNGLELGKNRENWDETGIRGTIMKLICNVECPMSNSKQMKQKIKKLRAMWN